MASMRRLKRRLARWERYTSRYRQSCNFAVPWGYINARAAVSEEYERRQLFRFYPVGIDELDAGFGMDEGPA